MATTATFGSSIFHNMTTRLIQQEFVVQPGYSAISPVTLNYAWSSFMNTYAVWPSNSGDSITIARSIPLQAGYYYVTGTVDNSGTVVVNGTRITLYNFDAGISRTEIAQNTRVYHRGGLMYLDINATNFGGPRGVAVTVSAEIVNTTSTGAITRSIGDLVWSTRSAGTNDTGRYQVTMPFRASITAHIWGAGGGGGGDDSNSPWGGPGSHGLYNTRTFIVNVGDTIEVFTGQGGSGGGSITGGSAGGLAGQSRILVNGVSNFSFNGGKGGNSGPSGNGGGGGGGGGASGILVNNVPVLIAGGGGGGGGAGDGGSGQGRITIASIDNNATGQTPNDYRGENGQNKSGNGGGGGAGGGGYPGGQGGDTRGGDSSAAAGQCGGNFPIFPASTGVNTPYYKSGFGGGGSRPGGRGQNGRIVLLIEPIGLNSVKISGSWKQINQAFVKVSGSWKNVENIYIKVGNNWKEVGGSGQSDLNLVPDFTNYSVSVRSYT